MIPEPEKNVAANDAVAHDLFDIQQQETADETRASLISRVLLHPDNDKDDGDNEFEEDDIIIMSFEGNDQLTQDNDTDGDSQSVPAALPPICILARQLFERRFYLMLHMVVLLAWAGLNNWLDYYNVTITENQSVDLSLAVSMLLVWAFVILNTGAAILYSSSSPHWKALNELAYSNQNNNSKTKNRIPKHMQRRMTVFRFVLFIFLSTFIVLAIWDTWNLRQQHASSSTTNLFWGYTCLFALDLICFFNGLLLLVAWFASMKLSTVLANHDIQRLLQTLQQACRRPNDRPWKNEFLPQLHTLVNKTVPNLCKANGAMIDLTFATGWPLAMAFLLVAIVQTGSHQQQSENNQDDNRSDDNNLNNSSFVEYSLGVLFILTPLIISLDVCGTSAQCAKIPEALNGKRMDLIQLASQEQVQGIHDDDDKGGTIAPISQSATIQEQREAALLQVERLLKNQNGGQGLVFVTPFLGLVLDPHFVKSNAIKAVGLASFLYGLALAIAEQNQ